MSAIICMASAKGGSGKTVLSASFATILAAIDKKVLLVDTDAATNGATLLYLSELLAARDNSSSARSSPKGLFELKPGETGDYVRLPHGGLFLPSTYELQNTEEVDIDQHRAVLRDAVPRWRTEFDYVFLDAQAGSDVYASTVIDRHVSDQVVIVSEYDPLSAAGVDRLKALFPEDLSFFRTWVILNKLLPEFVDSFSEFLEFTRYLRPIPWNADVVRAYARRQVAIDLRFGNEYTVAIVNSIIPLLSESDAADLAAYVDTRAAELREPLALQIEDLEHQLNLIRDETMRRKRSELLQRAVPLVVGAVGAIAGAAAVVATVGVSRTVQSIVLAAVGVVFVAAASLVGLGYAGRSTDEETSDPRYASLAARLGRLRTLAALGPEELFAAGPSGRERDSKSDRRSAEPRSGQE